MCVYNACAEMFLVRLIAHTCVCGLLLPYFVYSSFYELPAVTCLLASGCLWCCI